jgi:hypothetical protein
MRRTGLALSTALLVVSVLLLAAPSGAQTGATRIHLINGIPDTNLDIEIDGEVAVTDFAFRDTQDLSRLGGQSLTGFVVRDAASSEVIVDAGEIVLPASGNVTVMVHLTLDGSPSVAIFDNDISQLEPGQSRLVIRHLAAAPPVDVLAAGEVVFEGLANGQEVSADLPAGEVGDATLVPAGEDGPVIIGPADLPLLEGVLLIVYGLGSIEGDTMTVLTESVDGLDGTPSAVNTGNSLPAGGAGQPWPAYLALVTSVTVLGATAGSSLLADRSGRAAS